MVDYEKLVAESFRKLKQNPVLFNPVLVMLGLVLLYVIMVVIELFIVFMIGSIAGIAPEDLSGSMPIVVIAIIFFIFDILVAMGFLSYVMAMQYAMSREMVEKGETSNETMWAAGRGLWLQFFKLSWISLGLFVAPLVVLGPLNYYLITASIEPTTTAIVVMIASIVVFMVYAVVLALGLVFAFPMLSGGKIAAWQVIKSSFGYARAHPGHVFVTWLIIMAISFIVNLFFTAFKYLDIQIVTMIFTVVGMIAALLVNIWMNLFTFYSYNETGLEGKKAAKKR